MLTKAIKVLAGVAVAVATATLLPAAADASVQAAPNCQFGGTYGVRVDYAYVVTDSGVSVGQIQLCRDGNYNYWGFLLLNNSPTASEYGDAVLERDRDGAMPSFVGCESTGGNGVVLPGQTRCWTPKLSGLSGAYTFRAEGTLTSSHTGITLAYNSTRTTR